MKTRNTLHGVAIWLAALGWLSCQEETELPLPLETSVIQFTETQMTINENHPEKQIVMSLTKPARQSGTVTLVINSNHLSKFTTEPAHADGRIVLSFAKGSNTIAFLIKPLNDLQRDEEKTLAATIAGVSTGFQIGSARALAVSILDDDAPLQDRVEANFLASEMIIEESASAGSVTTISLSGPALAPGQIGLVYSSEKARYGIDFITEPVAENSKITLPVDIGSNQVSFTIIPLNNSVWLGDHKILFTLTNGQGSIKIGQSVVLHLTIQDDESAPKIKGFETTGNGWKIKRTYEYGYDDNLDKITWEQYTPAYQGGTYDYEYVQGRLHKMVENANRETFYLWEGDRIVKEEQYTNGLLSKYVLYHYDQAGNVAEAAYHYAQPDGSMKMGLLIVYLYYTDGNLFKKMVYNPAGGLDNLSLISTATYENYLAIDNPFPLEILPNINSQPKLPATYREEANGTTAEYNFVYELDQLGRPSKRTATSSKGTEVTTYSYQ